MKNERILNALREKKVLTACHRGAHGGNIIQNTIESCLCAYAQGADIAEIDAVCSIDGEYFVFHDTEECVSFGFLNNLRELTAEQIDGLRLINKYGCYTSQRVPRLAELLRAIKGKGLVNLDRCWGDDFSYVKGALDIIEREGMTDSVIFKSATNKLILDGLRSCGSNIPFMGIVNSVADVETIEKSGVNVVGYELLFAEDSAEILSVIPELQKKQYLIWVNSIVLNDTVNLSGGHDDTRALIEDKDANWGWLVDRGFNAIQTDYPQSLSDYLAQKLRKERSKV